MWDTSSTRGPWRGRLLALALSTLAATLMAEAFCRLRVRSLNQETLKASLSRPVALSVGGQASLGDLIQLSDNDRIAYELRPNLQGVSFKSHPVTTNSHGFRSPEVSGAARPGEVTIVGIGDSVLFGHGVADGECYLDQLQTLLSERRPERSWRIVNTGVPGYNTVMEVETLAAKGLAFEPDLVLMGVVGNDYEPPSYVRDAQDPWSLSRSFLAEFVRERLGMLATESPAPAPEWVTLIPEDLEGAAAPADVTLVGDGSLRVTGGPDVGHYRFTFPTDLEEITALRIEALPDESLPERGPGRAKHGNFVLSEVRLGSRVGDTLHQVELSHATAGYSQDGWPVLAAIDGQEETGWAVDGCQGQRIEAVLNLAEPLGKGEQSLSIELVFAFGEEHTLGRLRVSATDAGGEVRARTVNLTNTEHKEREAGLYHLKNWSKDEEEAGEGAPSRYADLYGSAGFERAVERLGALRREHEFELLAVCNITYDAPPYDTNKAREMLAMISAAGLDVLDLQYLLDEGLKARTGRPFSIPDYKASDLVVNPNNLHPSVLAHGMIAEALFEELSSSGVLDRLCR